MCLIFYKSQLNIDTNLGDQAFALGQVADAIGKGTHDQQGLGDPESDGLPIWDPEFLRRIDGFFLIAGDCDWTINRKIVEIENIFGLTGTTGTPSIRHVRSVNGNALPNKEEQ